MVFGVCMIDNPIEHIIVGKGSKSSSNRMKSRIPNSLVGQLVVFDIRKFIIAKNCVNTRPFNLLSIGDSSNGVQENTKVWVLG